MFLGFQPELFLDVFSVGLPCLQARQHYGNIGAGSAYPAVCSSAYQTLHNWILNCAHCQVSRCVSSIKSVTYPPMVTGEYGAGVTFCSWQHLCWGEEVAWGRPQGGPSVSNIKANITKYEIKYKLSKCGPLGLGLSPPGLRAYYIQSVWGSLGPPPRRLRHPSPPDICWEILRKC